VLSIVALFSSSFFVVSVLGCDDPRIMPSGNYCYYVEATNENGKTYTLPAHIIIEDSGEFSVYKVFFDNGGYLYFEDCFYDSVNFDETLYVEDQRENLWKINLTTKKTYHNAVNETEIEFNSNDAWAIALFALQVFMVVVEIFFMFKLQFDEFGHQIIQKQT
jgi:hypothetical protein